MDWDILRSMASLMLNTISKVLEDFITDNAAPDVEIHRAVSAQTHIKSALSALRTQRSRKAGPSSARAKS